MKQDEIILKLSKVQSKAIIALAKADAKSIKLIIATLLHQGIYWEWCEHDMNNEPANGWPSDWKEIKEELEQELKLLKDQYHNKINSEINQELKSYG